MKILLTIALLCFAMGASAQKVLQSGRYSSQKLRPADTLTINGEVIEKHKYKFFNWVTVNNGQAVYKISIVDSMYYNSLLIGQKASFRNCFKLDSRAWKEKN